jgi:hypothetical protein
LVGLALVPQSARHPAGLQHPLTSIGDFAGARIRDIPSGATDALLQSLGATPTHMSSAAVGEAISHHELDGEELSLANAPAGMYVTVNITFFEKASTIFANAASLNSLTAAQRDAVEFAARDTARHVVVASPSENQLIKRYCTAGHVVVAAESDVAAIERAASPVYAMLERDPQTRRLIGAIRRMKRTITPPPLVVPAGCAHSAATGKGVERSPAILNGTYRWRFTGQVGVSTATLRDGQWLFPGPDHDMGTYRIIGQRLIFNWPRVGGVLTFNFSRDPDGTIHLTPVLPMDPGDQQVWASSPWRRIGPPVAPIP